MGEVYRAEDTRLGRAVALKFVSGAHAGDASHRDRLLREARAASSLTSPNIAAIYDLGEHEGSVFLVMELVEGESLAARIARGPVPVGEAVGIALQVAEALEDAHGRHVVHRDIKSANIMLDGRGRVKVLDFGLAKILPGADDAADQRTLLETRQGTVLGTLAYMAPEQALGRPVDHRADLFALGVVIYEMVGGRLPFAGQSATGVLDQLLHHDPAPLAGPASGVPPRLDEIVRRAMAKSPEARYPSAGALRADLEALRRDLAPVSGVQRAGTSGWGSAADLDRGGRPAPVASGSGAAGVTPAGRGGATSGRSVAVMTFANITGEPADEWIGLGVAETVSSDLTAVRGLSVIGRTQVFEAIREIGRGATLAPDERLAITVGRQVGAGWVVVGGYQRLGPMLRITAQVVDVTTGTLVRTVKVDGRVDQIFELQDRIVLELGRGLDLPLADSAIADIARQETRSVEAYETYARALVQLRLATPEALDEATGLFEKAIALDEEYGKAWAGLGLALRLKGQFAGQRELVFRAVEALRRAVWLAPKLSEAHHELGLAYLATGHVEEAIEAIRTSLRLDPSNAAAHSALGRAHWLGRGELDEGVAELEHAAALNPNGGYAHLQLALLYALVGDAPRGEAAARRAIELQDRAQSGSEGLRVVGARLRLGYALYRQGRYDEAIAEYQADVRSLTASGHLLRERGLIEGHQKLAAAWHRAGDAGRAASHAEAALAAYAAREARGAHEGATEYYIAALHALRGDGEAAARHLRASFADQKALSIARARLDPDFDPVRTHPAIAALVG
jgi:TolB-like protein